MNKVVNELFFFHVFLEFVKLVCTSYAHTSRRKINAQTKTKKCSPAGRLKTQMFACVLILSKPCDNILKGKTCSCVCVSRGESR